MLHLVLAVTVPYRELHYKEPSPSFKISRKGHIDFSILTHDSHGSGDLACDAMHDSVCLRPQFGRGGSGRVGGGPGQGGSVDGRCALVDILHR
jgi:hypothetical protein